MARNSTWVTRSIGVGPHPPYARERTNAPIQSASWTRAVTPSSEQATTAAHRAHPRRRTSPSAAMASQRRRPEARAGSPSTPPPPVPSGDAAPPRRASVPARRRSPATPAGRRWSWSGPGGGRRARPAGFPGPAAAAPPGPGARRPGRRRGRRPGRSRQSQGASRRARTRPSRRRWRRWPPPRSPPHRSGRSGGSVASGRRVAACQPAWAAGRPVTSGTTVVPPVGEQRSSPPGAWNGSVSL